MKAIHKLFAFLLMICLPVFTSCEIPEIPQIHIPISDAESVTDAETTVPPPSERFTVQFDENEAFSTETERSASERIDPAIRKAVELLNTIGDESIPVSDCDYDARPKARDSLKYPQSKEIYDHILAKVSAFEDYCFYEKDFPGEDLFNLFVSATDALRIDHTELFLYCDGKIDG